jgi:hypothetical protein
MALPRVHVQVHLVPFDAPPVDKHGHEFWPEGWRADKRAADSERDVFALIGLPWREPSERNCN